MLPARPAVRPSVHQSINQSGHSVNQSISQSETMEELHENNPSAARKWEEKDDDNDDEGKLLPVQHRGQWVPIPTTGMWVLVSGCFCFGELFVRRSFAMHCGGHGGGLGPSCAVLSGLDGMGWDLAVCLGGILRGFLYSLLSRRSCRFLTPTSSLRSFSLPSPAIPSCCVRLYHHVSEASHDDRITRTAERGTPPVPPSSLIPAQLPLHAAPTVPSKLHQKNISHTSMTNTRKKLPAPRICVGPWRLSLLIQRPCSSHSAVAYAGWSNGWRSVGILARSSPIMRPQRSLIGLGVI